MSRLVKQLCLLTVFAVAVAGCKPINDLFGINEPPSTTTTNPESPGSPEAPGSPTTPPPELPTPQPGVVTVVLDKPTLVIAEGTTESLPVRLSMQPTADVAITFKFTANDGSVVSVGADTLTFTTSNWNENQDFQFSAPQDEDATDGLALADIRMDGTKVAGVVLVADDDEVAQNDGERITIKDASGAGSVNAPVTAVIPLEYGKFQNTNDFRIRDGEDNPVHAQFEVLNRWWARDNSIRHVVAHFRASAVPMGSTDYFFRTDGGAQGAGQAVTVNDTSNTITVDTGRVRFTVLKNGFNLFNDLYYDANGDGQYATSERVIAPGSSEGPVFTGRLSGDIQRAKDRSNISVTVEETGPARVVLRIESLGQFTSKSDHDHGFAVRIYAYAGSSAVKVDYQLQNSAKNVMYSWPLYFEDVSLNVKTTLTNPAVSFAMDTGRHWAGTKGHYLFQSSVSDSSVKTTSGSLVDAAKTQDKGQSMPGWCDVSKGALGMTVMVRNMAEMWPNGIEVETDENVAVRLWPKWSQQWHEEEFSATGLYWLEDMQHVVKETLFFFHGAETSHDDLDGVARNFQKHPIAALPLDTYRRTRVTLGLDGYIPADSVVDTGDADRRRIKYSSYELVESDDKYVFGWANYRGNVWRQKSTQTGSSPKSSNSYLVNGHIEQYLIAEARMWGDLNVRPIWIAGYKHDDDYMTIQPTDRKYGSRSWRNFEGHGLLTMAAPHLEGTGYGDWFPRDNDHGWFYHVEDYYYMSANLWIKDWYQWMSEFRKRSLLRKIGAENNGDPSDLWEWGWSTRGEGHFLAQCISAYRATGDPQLLAGLKNRMNQQLNAWEKEDTRGIDRRYGCRDPRKEACFQVGYLARSLSNLIVEMKGHQPQVEAEAFLALWGLMDWNYNYSHYEYYISTESGETGQISSGTSTTMIDPTALFYLWTGLSHHREYMYKYINGELGPDPYSYGEEWGGSFGSRLDKMVLAPKPNETAAAAISDVSARMAGSKVRLEWTTPANAARFLVVWSTHPISKTFTKDLNKRNVWGCEAVGTNMKAVPGSRQSIEFGTAPTGTKIYAAVLTFTADSNLSEASNIATVDVP